MAWWGKKTEKRLFDGLEPGYRKLFGPGKKLKPKKSGGGGKPKKGKK